MIVALPPDAGLEGFVSHVRAVVGVTGFFLCCHMQAHCFVITALITLHVLSQTASLCHSGSLHPHF